MMNGVMATVMEVMFIQCANCVNPFRSVGEPRGGGVTAHVHYVKRNTHEGSMTWSFPLRLRDQGRGR